MYWNEGKSNSDDYGNNPKFIALLNMLKAKETVAAWLWHFYTTNN